MVNLIWRLAVAVNAMGFAWNLDDLASGTGHWIDGMLLIVNVLVVGAWMVWGERLWGGSAKKVAA